MNTFSKEYQDGVKDVVTYRKDYEVKRFGDFYLHSLDTFWVISYHSSYASASRQKTFKSYKGVLNAWTDIVAGKTTYVNF